MRKRFLTLLLAATLAATSAVPVVTQPTNVEAATKKATKKTTKTKKSTKKKKVSADQKAADKVAKLIDQIYVQKRTATTDADCKKAKLAWDKLTSKQKKLVGNNKGSYQADYADPDYFGRDTGDASTDNPLNWNHIGDNEILVVSFGTSFNSSREADIGGVERALTKAYANQGWSVRRAFTSQIIINHVQARDGEKIDNVDQALQRAVDNGVKNLVIQPTHLMHGNEYDELKEEVNAYASKFQTVTFSEPLLGEVGADTKTVNADKETVAKAVTAEAVKEDGDTSLEAAAQAGTAFVFMGHGTSHKAAITYDQMQSQMEDLGYKNVFIGTVEGKPADTACDQVIAKVRAFGYKKVVLRPLMVVAGDHANNDMAGDDADSWKSQFVKAFGSKNVKCQIAGLGRISDIEQIYVNHLAEAVAANKTLTVSAVTGGAIQAVKAPVSAKKKLN
ncbi:MAG: sirohydrochlorin cobaltochelatase [Lachnospiraceae bacterium]|nr:sirohydrochlorin cobaltochelatase [Lachnospiraceae bacterium]